MLYEATPRVDGLCRFVGEVLAEHPRTNALMLLVAVDLIHNQGDSPANIYERTTGMRASTAAENCITRLRSMGFCELAEGEYQGGASGRRQVFLTEKAASLLELGPTK
jgi:hypothetical protein